MTVDQRLLKKLITVLAGKNASFTELVKLAPLDPETSFRGEDLARTVFAEKEDLRGYNFSGANLSDCKNLDMTMVDESTIFTNAIGIPQEVEAALRYKGATFEAANEPRPSAHISSLKPPAIGG